MHISRNKALCLGICDLLVCVQLSFSILQSQLEILRLESLSALRSYGADIRNRRNLWTKHEETDPIITHNFVVAGVQSRRWCTSSSSTWNFDSSISQQLSHFNVAAVSRSLFQSNVTSSICDDLRCAIPKAGECSEVGGWVFKGLWWPWGIKKPQCQKNFEAVGSTHEIGRRLWWNQVQGWTFNAVTDTWFSSLTYPVALVGYATFKHFKPSSLSMVVWKRKSNIIQQSHHSPCPLSR